MGTPNNIPPAKPADSAADVLVWPPPAAELEILWLDDEVPRVVAASPESDLSISFSRLRAPGVALEWHEAVALMQQLVDQVAPDRARPPAGSVPPFETIRLEPSGRLWVKLGPPGEPFVRGLGKLLTELLQSNPAPANLRLLAWQAASESAAPLRLDEIGQQLAGWERPGRAAALLALYARAASIVDAPSGVAVVPAPVRRIEPVAPPPAPLPRRIDAPAPPVLYSARTVALASAAASAAVLITAFIVYSSVRGAATVAVPSTAVAAAPTPAASPDSAALATASVGGPSSSVGATPVGSTGAVSGDIELPTAAPGRRTRGAASIRRGSGSVRTPAGAASGPLVIRPMAAALPPSKAAAIQMVPLELFAARADRPVTPEPSIFTSDDASVVEPVLVRPYLPFRAHAGTPPEALGMLELVIDTHGAVESVHLNSPDNRYRERWWMFSAKTWRFQPATKDGRPVRFLKRIPLTDLNMLEPQ